MVEVRVRVRVRARVLAPQYLELVEDELVDLARVRVRVRTRVRVGLGLRLGLGPGSVVWARARIGVRVIALKTLLGRVRPRVRPRVAACSSVGVARYICQ